MTNEQISLKQIETAADKIAQTIQHKPEVVVIDGLSCDSLYSPFPDDQVYQWSPVAELGATTTAMAPLPRELRWGYYHGLPALHIKGIFHQYDGISPQQQAFSIRVLNKLGIHTIVFLNECISVTQLVKPSTLFFVQDHINLTGSNPLTGTNDDAIGPRFPDMSAPYDRDLLDFAEKSAIAVEFYQYTRGITAGISGPSLPTPAECRMYQRIGAQVATMSGVPETIAAVHAGLRVLTISAVTRQILPDSPAGQHIHAPFALHQDASNLAKEVLRNVAAGTR